MMDLPSRLLPVALSMLLAGVRAHAQAPAPQQWRDSLSVLNGQIARETVFSTDLHLKKGAVNLQLSQWDYAADEYTLVLEKEPHNPAALFYRAYAYMNQRKYDMARRDYEYLLLQHPFHLSGRIGLSYAFQQQGKLTEALDQLNRAVEFSPDSAVAYAARASLETAMGLHDASLLDWDEALRLHPGHIEYALSRVQVLLQLGKKQEARQSLDAMTGKGISQGELRGWYERCKRCK